jgi:hypothetical protein
MVTLASDSALLVQGPTRNSSGDSQSARCLGLVGVFASQPMFRGWTSTNHKAHKRLPSESQSWKGNRLFTSSAYTHNKCHHDMHTMIYSRT